jgi:hypothetical protein
MKLFVTSLRLLLFFWMAFSVCAVAIVPAMTAWPLLDPIPQPALSPANFHRLDWVNGSAFAIPGNSFTVQLRSENIWNRASDFTNQGGLRARYAADVELEQVRLSFCWVPAPKWQVQFEGALALWCGGWMDAAIEDFHTAMMNRDHDRPRYARNQVRIDSGSWVSTRNQVTLAPWIVRPQWTFFSTSNHALAARFDVSLPVGEWLEGWVGTPGLGGGLRYSGRWKRLQWDTGIGGVLQAGGQTAPSNLEAYLARLFFDASLTVSFRSGLSFVYGIRYAGPLYQSGWGLVASGPGAIPMNEFISSGFNTLFTPQREITMALRYDRPDWAVALTLVEDLFPASTPDWTDTVNNAPDLSVGIHAGWKFRSGPSAGSRPSTGASR